MANICPCTFGNAVSSALNNLRNAKKLNARVPEQTSPATVLSREVRHINTHFHENPYQYILRVRPENGEELELKTNEETYRQLPEGTTATLTWQDDSLLSYRKYGG